MSYNTIARAAQDGDLQDRVAAAAAQEGHPSPRSFATAHAWDIAANVNVTGPYESAVAARTDRPGYYEDVITDAALLAVVQPLVAVETAPTTP